jgi:non-specific serine/threonine protein kinase
VLSPLTNLVEKSLVLLDPESGRYRMLETVRQYALERLVESGEADSARTRHAEFYFEFAERAVPELFGPQQGAWLAQLDLDRENLLAVHAWFDRAEDGAALGLRLVHALKPYLMNRGLLELEHRMALEALARPGAQARNAARGRALFDAGQTRCFMGRYDDGRHLLEEGLAIAREIGDPILIGNILQPLGLALLGQGNRAEARKVLEEALELERRRGNKRDIAAALNALAQLHRVEGSLEEAEPLYEQVVAIAREIGDRETIAIGLLNLAMVFVGREDASRARATLIECDAIADETGSRPVAQSVLEVCAGLAAFEGDWPRTARFFGMAEAQNALTGISRDPADEAFLAPHVASARAQLGDAAFAAADAGGRALGFTGAKSEARRWLDGNG